MPTRVRPDSRRTALARAADLLDPPMARYRKDPVMWAKERLGIDLWSKQREIIASVRDNKQTSVHSCHQVGKSFTAAVTIAWFIDVHPAGSAFVVSTAPTGAQVEAILWRELNKFHVAHDLPGRMNLVEWYLGKEMVAFGRKPSDHNPHAFQGLHAEHFLVVLDEACGVVPIMWNASSSLITNKGGRALAIGNPDDRNTEFGENCKPGSGWNVIHVSAYDTPNFTGEPVPKIVSDSLITPDWVEDRRRKWGDGSALFQSKCLGQFPDVGDPYAVVPYAWAVKCRSIELAAAGDMECGVDVGGGGDRTVCRLRQGRKALLAHDFVNPDPMATVGDIGRFLAEHEVVRVRVDTVGIGWGVYGRLRELSSLHNPGSPDTTHGAEVIGVNFGAGPPAGFEKKFLNMRAYAHWQVGRELSRLGTWDLTGVDDDLIHELTVSKYEIMDSHGKIKVERKEKVKARLGFSPDQADALLLAFLDWNRTAVMHAPAVLGEDLTRAVAPGEGLVPGRSSGMFDGMGGSLL